MYGIQGRIRIDWGSPKFGSERTVKVFCGKLLLTETTTCHFGISLDLSLVGKCNARFIKKISQLKSDIRIYIYANISKQNKQVKCSHGLTDQELLRITHDSCLLSVY